MCQAYAGKIIFVILMLVGRFGPLTMAFLLAKTPKVSKICASGAKKEK
jgi:Trk-type K+ transport system membrane component